MAWPLPAHAPRFRGGSDACKDFLGFKMAQRVLSTRLRLSLRNGRGSVQQRKAVAQRGAERRRNGIRRGEK